MCQNMADVLHFCKRVNQSSLSPVEKNYAQIKKELLAVVYGLQKFHQYTYGRKVSVITDHKPLVTISNKPLLKAPKRLQSLLLKAQAYNFNIQYRPGTQIPISDTLSRAHQFQTQSHQHLMRYATCH